MERQCRVQRGSFDSIGLCYYNTIYNDLALMMPIDLSFHTGSVLLYSGHCKWAAFRTEPAEPWTRWGTISPRASWGLLQALYLIQANGMLTFKDDLRSGGLLCFTTQWTNVHTGLANSMVTLGEPGMASCREMSTCLQDTSCSAVQSDIGEQ